MATIEIPNGDRLIQVGPNERVTFKFVQDAVFQASDGNSFDPPLLLGAVKAGTTAVHRPVPGSENTDVLYCYALHGSTISPCKNPLVHPDTLAGHIIHIGSGGSRITKMEVVAFEAALESVAKEPAFLDLWPSAKSFLNLLLKAKPAIPSRFRVIIQILVMTGDSIFLRLKRRK
jgi:hypothetical protein